MNDSLIYELSLLHPNDQEFGGVIRGMIHRDKQKPVVNPELKFEYRCAVCTRIFKSNVKNWGSDYPVCPTCYF
jgi:hypothetical protein